MTVVRSLLFLAVGVLVGGVIAHIVTHNAWYAFAWGSAALVAVVLAVVLGAVSVAAGAGGGAGGSSESSPTRTSSWAAAGAALLGVLIVLVPSIPALTAGPPPAPVAVSSDLRVGNGPQAIVTAVLSASGQSKIAELDIRYNYATVVAPEKSGSSQLGFWDYRNGHLLSFDVGSESPDDADSLFDARTLDFGQVGLAVKKTVALSGIKLNSESYVLVERALSGGDGPGDRGSPTISVYLDDGSRDAHIEFNFDLSVVDKGGSVFDG